jgi:diacylglycerol kinase family enzyme
MTGIDITRPVYLIVNPHSGYGMGRHMLRELRAAANDAGVTLREHRTRGLEDATHFAREVSDEAAAVLVWGGDGTVNAVAAGLAGTSTPFLPCPVGTENLLASDLRIPNSPERIIGILQSGRIVPCDMGTINGKSFLLVIGIGFDGEVVQRLTAERSGHITQLSYFWPIWRTFWEHRFPLLRILADGEPVFDGPGLAFVGNIARYASGLQICRDARYDDGLLDLVVFPCSTQWTLVLHAARTLLRTHPSHPRVVYRQFRNVRIESTHPVPSQVDGDVGPMTPLEIAISPHQVNLIAPRSANGRTRTGDNGKDRA